MPGLAPSDFHLFSHLSKFLSGQRHLFQNYREAEISVTQWFQSQAADLDTGYKSWSLDVTNVSISEVLILKNSSTLAVWIAINVSIKLGFVSVNSPGKLTLWSRYVVLVGRSEGKRRLTMP